MELRVLDNQVLDWGPLELPLKSWLFEDWGVNVGRFWRPVWPWTDVSSLGSCILSQQVPTWSGQAPTQVPCPQEISQSHVSKCRKHKWALVSWKRLCLSYGTWFSQLPHPLVRHPLDPGPLFLLYHSVCQVYPMKTNIVFKHGQQPVICGRPEGSGWCSCSLK